MLKRTLQLRTSPHLHSGTSVEAIMSHVAWALVPACLFAVYHFGLSALWVLVVAVVSCLLTEHVTCRLQSRPTTLGDRSVVVTGLLFGMTLPPSLPLWMVALGAVVAVAVGKMMFGGLGANPFNPALVGRAFLQAAFPTAMTTWPPPPAGHLTTVHESTLTWPLMRPDYGASAVDGISGATPLGQWKTDGTLIPPTDLFFGTVPGCVGETSAVLLLIGGLYLISRQMMNWRIPVAILGTVAIGCLVLDRLGMDRRFDPGAMLFSGGLMLGAMFMATDMVASPMTSLGCVLYGMLIGALVLVIRAWSGMPEGVMYAILLGNAVSPLIDRCIGPRFFAAPSGGVAG
jgi:Na+-translocating ferredoxin:NAD+ oxidoreductase subunit D